MSEQERSEAKGKRDLLLYLIKVAQDTQGAEVWRAMFAEMLKHCEKALEAGK